MTGIIPKPIKKTPKLYKFSPHIVFGLIIAVILIYISLLYFTNEKSKVLLDLQEKIAQVGTKEERVLEAQVLLDKRQIDDFSKVFADHKKASLFFEFLEENCHPKIWFNKLELSTIDANAVLTGETLNFETLGQQIAIFQNSEFVEKIEISDLSIAKNGRASIMISLSLNPAIFQ